MILALAPLAMVAAAAVEEPPLLPVGADCYGMWERWPYQRIGERAYLRSTYDRSGGNEASDASHFLYQLAPDHNVTLDVAGPGMLYFVRTNRWHGSPWHYTVDGVDHLVAESNLPSEPIALTWSKTAGSDLSWAPIGFQNSLRLAYSHTFYGTGYYIYHRYVAGAKLSRPIVTWDARVTADPVIGHVLNLAGSDIAPEAGNNGVRAVSGRIDLPARGSTTVWQTTHTSAMVRALELSVPRAQAQRFAESFHLRATWDGRAEPSIDAPVALFFGSGTLYNRDGREYLVKSLPMVIRFDAQRVYLSCYFPMPFFQAARIELVGNGFAAVTDVRWRVRYQPYTDPPNQVGYFHATYRDHWGAFAPRPGIDLVLLDTARTEGGAEWSGAFVGTSFIFSHAAQLTTLEGDPRFFFDDSQTPQAQGTGTEGWAGGGDYWSGQNTTLPLAGHPVGAPSPAQARNPADAIESAYRFLLADLMPFGRRALIRLEHGGRNESTEHYETIAYWYGLPAPSLIQTDELEVGDVNSEERHRYESPSASAAYELTSRYEWGPDHLFGREIYPATTDRGRTTLTYSEFTLKTDPGNWGVLLRRKLDYELPNQRAEVYVQVEPERWEYAGTWYLAGSNTSVFATGGGRELGPATAILQTSNRRFREDEFLLPRALTRGRSTIRVRIRVTPVTTPLLPGGFRPAGAWSEMRYLAYSYVMPDFPRQ